MGDDATPATPGGAWGGEEWVVPREACQFRRLDLSALPARQRRAAARLAVARHLPASDAVSHVAWHAGIAHVWIWPDAPVRFQTGECRWIPESLLVPPPEEDGARLLQLPEGVEGQVWREGGLEASQWWPAVPEREGWQRFLRGAGLDAEAGRVVPAPVSLPWSRQAWGERDRLAWAGSARDMESLAWKAAGGLLVLALGWQGSSLVRWEWAAHRQAQQLELEREKIAPLLQARERAESRLAEVESLLQFEQPTSDYEMMYAVVEALPEGTELTGWRREPGRLQVQVRSRESDPRRFVSAFATRAHFADVTVSPGANGQMQLDFRLGEIASPGSG